MIKKIKNLAILSLVSFILGGTIYFSLTAQDQTVDKPDVKGVESDRQTTNSKKVAYVNPPGVETDPTPSSITPTTQTSPSPTRGIQIITSAPKVVQSTSTPTPTTAAVTSPTPTFGARYENTAITTLPTPTVTLRMLPTQAGSNPVVTLPVAGPEDYISKIAVGAGMLILAAFLL